jgi:hypothetical protein
VGKGWAVHQTADSLKKARHAFSGSVDDVFPSAVFFCGGKPGLVAAKAVVSAHYQANKSFSNLDKEPDVVYLSITDFEGYQSLIKASSTRFFALPPTLVSQQPSAGSVISLSTTLYLYAAASNETHRLEMARHWASGAEGDFGLGIGQLLSAIPTLHGTFAGDAFVDFAHPPFKVESAALAMLMVNRCTRVGDIIWDLSATLTANHLMQLPTLPAAALSLSRKIVCVTKHLVTAELICQTFDYLQDTCQPYFDGFWLEPPKDGQGTMFYQPNVILGMHTQTIDTCA